MEDTLLLDESMPVLNDSKDFSFILKNKKGSKKTLDITFAGNAESRG